jgi:hypothetical protein
MILQCDGRGLADHQPERRIPRDQRDIGGNAKSAQAGAEGASQQDQEQHAAQGHGLRDDRQPVNDDRQVAEQINQQLH